MREMLKRAMMFGVALATVGQGSAWGASSFKLRHQDFSPAECGLKRVTFVTTESVSENQFGGINKHAGTGMRLFIDTTAPACARDYAVVQWIKGCIYDVSKTVESGESMTWYGTGRESRGKHAIFRHADWEVDSTEIDPMAWAGETKGNPLAASRFSYYRIPKKPVVWSDAAIDAVEVDRIADDDDLSIPFETTDNASTQFFLRDTPTSASWRSYPDEPPSEWATNVSLEFKACVYRTRDVPLKGDPARFDVPAEKGGPIVCFDWVSKNRWNFETKQFERDDGIDPFCSRAL